MTSQFNTHIPQYVKELRQSDNEIWSVTVTEYNMKNIFLKNHTQNVVEKLFPNYFLKSQSQANLWIKG